MYLCSSDTGLPMLASLLLGCPIWAPPAFRTKLEAFVAARQGRGN